MDYLIFIVIGFTSFIVGVFGFAQIIGSIRSRQTNFLLPIVIWCVILIIVYYLVKLILPIFIIALYLGYFISFLIIISQTKIE
jgi:hypothetical protein